MIYLQSHNSFPPERIERISDEASGLNGVIVVQSTRRGPAAGGCRLWTYRSESEMLADAVRLADASIVKLPSDNLYARRAA